MTHETSSADGHGRRPRLSDVALRAGVSKKTVSNVINNYEHVSARTRSQVQEALEELSYKPHPSARHLAGGRTGFIELAVSGIDNPYFAKLARDVIDQATRFEWTVLIEQTGARRELESASIGQRRPYLVDGVILHAESVGAEEIKERDIDIPVVLIGEGVAEGFVDHVVADNVIAASDVVDHLIGTGRRRIATIGITAGPGRTTSTLRHQGITDALERHGLTFDPALQREVPSYRRVDGARETSVLMALPNPPQAIICFNDLVATGCLRALDEAGIDVPGDVAVVGFDDIEEAEYSSPPLTTVSWDTAEIARRSVELLHERLIGGEAAATTETVGHRLVLRKSTNRP